MAHSHIKCYYRAPKFYLLFYLSKWFWAQDRW